MEFCIVSIHGPENVVGLATQISRYLSVIQGVSASVNELMCCSAPVDRLRQKFPAQLDFIFIDGDHSANGIAFDWALAKQRLAQGGIVCLHDVYVPDTEPWRRPESVAYFVTVICTDPEFSVVDRVHSLAVLRRNTL